MAVGVGPIVGPARAASQESSPPLAASGDGERFGRQRSAQSDGRVTLREYVREVLVLSAAQANALNRVGGGQYLTVEPGEHSGHWQVGARHYVGSINVAGLQVLVRPKIPLRNLFLLLEVGLRERDWHDEAVRFETTGDLLPALVSFFARTTETTLTRGLYHSYREQRDRLIALRGRVDIARQLTQPGVVIPTACKFTEFTADVIENSYLKAAVSRSLRVAGVQPIDRRRLMQHLVTLEDVGDVRHHHTDDDQVVFTRLNEHYKPALRLARLVLANLTLQDVAGETQASSFMLDMNELFERFVTEAAAKSTAGTPRREGPAPRPARRRALRCDPARSSVQFWPLTQVRSRHQIQAHRRHRCRAQRRLLPVAGLHHRSRPARRRADLLPGRQPSRPSRRQRLHGRIVRLEGANHVIRHLGCLIDSGSPRWQGSPHLCPGPVWHC